MSTTVPMVHEALTAAVATALAAAQAGGELPAFDLPASIPVERPKAETMGDYATPVALQLARVARISPLKIAQAIARHLPALPFLDSAQAEAPGFVNFRLSTAWLTSQVDAILAAGDHFGDVPLGGGQRVQVEYVSANPTGPLHVGAARNAILGDALAAVMAATGHEVQREYYVNDAGTQVGLFGETLYARYAQALGRQEPVPEQGYHGQYMVEWGQQIAREHGARFLDLPRDDAVRAIGELGLEFVVGGARADLDDMGITYDRWFSERTLYADGTYDRVLDILREGDHLEARDGALWFRATALGGGKDEVVVRSTGKPGYFASDIAYHYDKFVRRGFERVIDVWGADHQGHVPRMRAMMIALGLDPDRLTIVLYQLATFKRGGEVVRLSKRTGDMITLREVLDEVGADAVRYFLLARAADSQLDFDLDLAKERSDENPVYYVQYAHARICSILRFAGELAQRAVAEGDAALLSSEPELNLIRRMLRLPEIVRLAALYLAPHHLTYFAYELAAAFHTFYRDCRVVSAEPTDEPISKARLKLVSACRLALARALGLMGMTAPESM